MKKLLLITATIGIIALIVVFGLAFIRFNEIEDQIADQIIQEINRSIGLKSEVGSTSIQWAPYPSLVINQVEASTDSAKLILPKIVISPDWKYFFYRQLTLGQIILIKPHISLTSFDKGKVSLPTQFSGIKLVIKDGTLETPSGEYSSDLILRASKISNINATIYLENTRLTFDISAISSFSNNFSATGLIDFKSKYYQINTTNDQLNFADIIKSYGEKIIPLNHTVNLNSFIEGVTANNFKIKLNGELPPFKLSRDNSFDIRTSNVKEIILEKYDSNFFVEINDLHLTSPKLLLNGKISRELLSDSSEPVWNLDLAAKDANLTEARDFVLNLWGDNVVAKTVCSIVLNGHANSVRYLFNGPVIDFKYINNMEIFADVEEAEIDIPSIELKIEKAKGKIAITDGNLTGKNLKAMIGDSIGSMGEILLDLRENGDAFKLELDLDVNITTLHDTLINIIDSPSFQKELAHFSDLNGRASGHLSLGETLGNLNTTVKVRHIKGNGYYDRIAWPFTISKAELFVMPDKTEWSSAQVSFGPHEINNSSGSVSWQNETKIDMTSFNASLDTNNFFQKGYLKTDSNIYQLSDYLSGYINDISGQLLLSNGTLSGDASTPESWEYQFDFSSGSTELSLYGLNETITSYKLTGQLTEISANFYSYISFLTENLEISSQLSHNNLSSWRGSTEFTGIVDNNIIKWLDLHYNFPPFPALQTPFLLDKLKVTSTNFSSDDLSISGSIKAGLDDNNLATLDIDYNRRKNFLMTTLDIKHKTNHGKFVYNIWDTIPQRSLITWQGAIQSITIDKFFKDHPFEMGQINGVFSILNTNYYETSSFSGYLNANDVKLREREGVPSLSFPEINISGNDDKLTILNAQISFDDNSSAELDGIITASQNDLGLDLNVSSEHLSSKTLNKTFHKFIRESIIDSHAVLADGPDSEIEKKLSNYGIIGNIDFAIGNFIYSLTAESNNLKNSSSEDIAIKNGESLPQNLHSSPQSNKSTSQTAKQHPNKKLHWSPLKGQIGISDNDMVAIDFSEAKLCGIEMTGSYIADNKTSNGIYNFKTPGKPNFQTSIPCLNFDKSVITGDFILEANVSGNSGEWQKGSFSLYSASGIIHKMDFLSKIFSVVNFTEFLAFNDLSDIKADGLKYNDLIITGYIKDNNLIMKKASLKGMGLNLTGQGSMNLQDLKGDFTFFVAPFKMLDSVVTTIPLVGRIVGGKKGAILTFPVRVSGHMRDPIVTPLSPTAIGKATLDFITDTLSMPFAIFSPFVAEAPVEDSIKVNSSEQIIEENLPAN